MKKIILKLIKLYQSTLSLDHSWLRHLRSTGQCKFHPSCSEYTHQAIEKYGVITGTVKALKRLLHCHPWSLGGCDELK